MSKPNRSAARELLVSGLQNKLNGVVDAVNIVGYHPVMRGEYCWVSVLSDGSERPRMTLRGTSGKFYVGINVYVIREADTLTRAQAESKLDEIEALIAEYLDMVSGKTSAWESLDYEARSKVSPFIPEGGIVYLLESIPLVISGLK